MDQKFISGNFLPPPRGYPPIAPLNNDHHPALRTSPLPFFQSGKLLKRPPIRILLPFPSLKLGQLQGWKAQCWEGEGEGEHLVPSSIPPRLIRGRIDRPALPPPHRFTTSSNTLFSPIPPQSPKYSPQFPSPPSTHSLVLAKGHGLREKLKEAPSRDLAQLDPLSS